MLICYIKYIFLFVLEIYFHGVVWFDFEQILDSTSRFTTFLRWTRRATRTARKRVSWLISRGAGGTCSTWRRQRFTISYVGEVSAPTEWESRFLCWISLWHDLTKTKTMFGKTMAFHLIIMASLDRLLLMQCLPLLWHAFCCFSCTKYYEVDSILMSFSSGKYSSYS